MDHLDNIFGKSNLLDLSKKIFNIVLNEDVFYEEYQLNLNSEILKAETINFVLADGLGTENLKISRSDFLNNSNSFSVNSTFPSSTNVALSTINYVSKPVDTAILGYYLFDENEYGLINALNWNQDNKSILTDVDIKDNKTIWTILKSKGITSNNIQPKDLIKSALSEYIYKDSHQIAYKDTDELNEIISDSSVLDNRFNFIYYPNIDISAHVFGVGSEEWHKEIDIFEKFIKNIVFIKKSFLLQKINFFTKKSAFFFGKEKDGLSNTVLNNADGFLKIPMYGFTESLNISVSAAIILQSVVARLKDSNIDWKLTESEKKELNL